MGLVERLLRGGNSVGRVLASQASCRGFESRPPLFPIFSTMTYQRKRLGRLGERLAKNYLKKQGYRILALNFKRPWGEIDIVASKKNSGENPGLVFIEVKTETKSASLRFGPPEEKVGPRKQRKLIRLAQGYLLVKKYSPDTNWRIDVISVEVDKETRIAALKHIKNAVTG